MTLVRSAALGLALALGAVGAHAQTVVTTQRIDNEPVETTVTQTPTGTVITRRPLAPAPLAAAPLAPAPVATPAGVTYLDETVGAAPMTRTTTRRITRHVSRDDSREVVRHIVHHARRITDERTVRRTVRTTRRIAAAPAIELAPAQRRVIYRTLVQEQVVPRVVAQPAPVVPGYPPFPAPAYQPRTVVVEPSATTGYAVSVPRETVDDDVYGAAAAPVPVPAPVYAAPGPVYTVGSVLPASVAVAPLPVRATVAVPAVRPYDYATVDNRVLLVDPATNTVVADITP